MSYSVSRLLKPTARHYSLFLNFRNFYLQIYSIILKQQTFEVFFFINQGKLSEN